MNLPHSKLRRFAFWFYGLTITTLISAALAYNLTESDKTLYLTGEASHGHYQIEMACNSCHGDGFGGADFMQKTCVGCHGDSLELSDDSHPRKKFLDPRNASLLSKLDARQCVTCHTEHKPEITREMGVTLAGDFCVHCHSDIAEDRPSHIDLAFDSCTSCHNYHDNRVLHEDFLSAHLGEANLLQSPALPTRTLVNDWLAENPDIKPLSLSQADLFADSQTDTDINTDWAASIHARAAVNCSDCHINERHVDGQMQLTSMQIVAQCGDCHRDQRTGFSSGKHGMRLSNKLGSSVDSAMSPTLARSKMKEHAQGELNCASCHEPHRVDLHFAAVDACLNCHNDEHSLAYKSSPHFLAWEAKRDDGVSCAGCHLPREAHGQSTFVNHNQNDNLRPTEKMLPVCLNCHGTEFSLSSLTDKKLLGNNFSGKPEAEHKSFEMIRERLLEIAQKNNNDQPQHQPGEK